MLHCKDCDRLFPVEDADKIYVDQGEYFGFPAHEPTLLCPYCKSDDIEHWDEDNVDVCICCGEPIPEGRQVCPDCECKNEN